MSDVVIVGGGLAGAALATVLARRGIDVVVLEKETRFKDRVRGENMLPWGVAAARRLGLVDTLVAAGGKRVPYFNTYAMGTQTEHRPLPDTTPTREASLNMYHPDLQEALIAGAIKAGAHVQRAANVHGVSEENGRWTVTYSDEGGSRTVTPRLVVGADGRFSKMRDWAGFTVNKDPERLRLAGVLVERSSVPDDGTHLSMGPGILSFIAPLGGGRVRMYFAYMGAMGDRKLSGKAKVPEFLDACRASMAPAAWFEGVEVTGPLAEFEGADRWVASPVTPGLALIGDAAAATDPSWGCGLSKTLVDVELLSNALVASDDWETALRTYAAEHDRLYGQLHDVLSWMTELMWTGGPAADERRARVFAQIKADPTGFPDPSGQGPFGPCDEQARRKILGLA